jgi:hypothetical protein
MTLLQFTRNYFQDFLDQKLITEMKQPSCSADFTSNGFWPFTKIKCALKGSRFKCSEDIKRKCYDATENYFTTGVPNMFPTVASSLG